MQRIKLPWNAARTKQRSSVPGFMIHVKAYLKGHSLIDCSVDLQDMRPTDPAKCRDVTGWARSGKQLIC